VKPTEQQTIQNQEEDDWEVTNRRDTQQKENKEHEQMEN
jgi:hypothetical protein